MSNDITVERIAAFSIGDTGGNPAGVALLAQMPAVSDMQRIAAEIGFSETVFAVPENDGWRARYFSPESEVPFCGHATIALGAALARHSGDGTYPLFLNEANITIEGHREGDIFKAALQSPPTYSKVADPDLVDRSLALLGYDRADLDSAIPPAFANGGANHLILMLNSRERLAEMNYDLDQGRKLMNDAGLVTILLGYAESPQSFHTRSPFASGGVLEDPATGAATAALAGYLRDLNWPHAGRIEIVQGQDMGCASQLVASFTDQIGSSIKVSGAARLMTLSE
ncbi:phenazine biosynthesis family protein [Rhodobacterales bacterium HTCC2150]|nr:phenazine biosynthesis family protein [Rhodobacterales bacterium HTCC2150] [Rhodobacteraceae bacterium HTCC2150]